jgi:hypothetical protein
MATAVRDFERSFVCGSSTLIAKQFYIVKQDTDGTVILGAASTDHLVGVLQNKPAVGAAALVRFLGTTKVIAGGTINPGDNVTTDGNGKAVATTTNKDVILGTAILSAAAASGDIIEVMLGSFIAQSK